MSVRLQRSMLLTLQKGINRKVIFWGDGKQVVAAGPNKLSNTERGYAIVG